MLRGRRAVRIVAVAEEARARQFSQDWDRVAVPGEVRGGLLILPLTVRSGKEEGQARFNHKKQSEIRSLPCLPLPAISNYHSELQKISNYPKFFICLVLFLMANQPDTGHLLPLCHASPEVGVFRGAQ